MKVYELIDKLKDAPAGMDVIISSDYVKTTHGPATHTDCECSAADDGNFYIYYTPEE